MRSHSKALVALAALFIASLSLASVASAAQVRPHATFGSGGTSPGSVAVDPSNGDAYVLDTGFPGAIQRFDSSGAPKGFADLGGSNTLNGSDVGSDNDQTPANGFSFDAGSQLAIDRSGVATDGTIYVADSGNQVVDVFANSGEYLGQLNGSGTPQGEWAEDFGYPCGVAVDGAGAVYVSTAFGSQINRYVPAASPVQEADYEAQIDGVFTCALAVNSSGDVYSASTAFGIAEPVVKYAASDFGTTSPTGTQVAPLATAIALDPSNDDLYVNTGSQIEHFDSTGAVLEDPFGSPYLTNSHGVGVDSSAGKVYASQAEEVTPPTDPPTFEGKAHFFSTAIEVEVDPATDVTTDSATLNGHLDPGGVDTDYYFEYTTDGTVWIPVPGEFSPSVENPDGSFGRWKPQPVNAGSSSSSVSQSTSSAVGSRLQAKTTYRARLHTTSTAGDTISPEITFTTPGMSPDVQTRSAGTTETTASLAGRVHPHGTPTTYWFEYGAEDCSANPCTSAPLSEDGDAGSGNEWKEVFGQITGLTPGTTYHFRIIAENEVDVAVGVDRTFTTNVGQPPQPPARGYEKVSPDAKNGVSVRALALTTDQPGKRAAFYLAGNAVDAKSGQGRSTLFSVHAPLGGWTAHSLEPSLPIVAGQFGHSAGAVGFSRDLSKSVWDSTAPLSQGMDPTKRVSNLFLRDNVTGVFTLLTPNQMGGTYHYIGASKDFSRIFYSSTSAQTGVPVSAGTHIYAWENGDVELVDWVDSDGDGSGPEQPSLDGAAGGSGQEGKEATAVSGDGSRIVFQATEPSSTTVNDVAGQIYVREDNGAQPARTIHVNASQRTAPDPNGPLPATFWAAEKERGGKVLFTTCEKLTDDATIDSSSPECKETSPGAFRHIGGNRDLYLYNVDSGELTNLTAGDPGGGDVHGVVGASDDLSSVYYVAGAVLAEGEGALEGAPNLYHWSQGSSTYIATLRDDDGVTSSPPGADKLLLTFDAANWALIPNISGVTSQQMASRVSADGSTAVFISRAPLTGYDNSNPAKCPSYGGGELKDSSLRIYNPEGRCLEVFRYSADRDQLVCVSCDPHGASPQGDAVLTTVEHRSFIPPPAALSENGSKVFFESPDPLAPAAGDSNGKVDVYVWDRGLVRLLTDGLNSLGSQFAGATPDGSNAFVRTRAQLVRSDNDELFDIYDVRAGGGFDPAPPPTGCEGDSCQSPPLAPNDATPSSSSFKGPSNPRPASRRRCAKGKVRRDGKCLRRKRRNGSRANKSNHNRRAHR